MGFSPFLSKIEAAVSECSDDAQESYCEICQVEHPVSHTSVMDLCGEMWTV